MTLRTNSIVRHIIIDTNTGKRRAWRWWTA
jgi:hypothetical protein